uniref:GAF domain-containing protein n=1 Tax=Ningiella ruwaisensis TaxID=2364274 RepID=UPI00109F6243|nr:GAF domain-containing protein [Ningiella ruwaisensis]
MLYSQLCLQAKAIIEDETDLIANLANISALLFNSLEDVNWAGFYLLKDGRDNTQQLVLGPFQGQVACIRINIGKGVCGTAASTLKTQVVEDVHQFAGHIACDAASNSEIVLPIIIDGRLIGVLDIDSPKFARFDNDDAVGLENLVKILIEQIRKGEK